MRTFTVSIILMIKHLYRKNSGMRVCTNPEWVLEDVGNVYRPFKSYLDPGFCQLGRRYRSQCDTEGRSRPPCTCCGPTERPGVDVIKLFSFVTDATSKQAKVFHA